MRIAFVGKGGSGKTTLTALFSECLKRTGKPVLVFDADLNIHLPQILGLKELVSPEVHISSEPAASIIKQNLIENNHSIESIDDLKKTTLPSIESNLIDISKLDESIISKYLIKKGNLNLAIIGTYEENKIGRSCYHGNLSIFEIILNHTIDDGGYIVADMVAGVDAFANTLHAQFDILALVVEPTRRSVEVYNHYMHLAEKSGVERNLFVIANKIASVADEDFIHNNIPSNQLIGTFYESKYLKEIEKTADPINLDRLEDAGIELLESIKKLLEGTVIDGDSIKEKRFERIIKIKDRV